MRELWKPVVGYEGTHEVSTEGRIRRTCDCANTKKGHVLKPELSNCGYFLIGLHGGGKKTFCTVHSIVVRAFLGGCRYSFEVNHRDGVKTNNRLSNLEYLTHSENKNHAVRLLGSGSGSHNGNSKLTESAVKDMRLLHHAGVSYSDCGRRYSVTPSVARKAIIGFTWKNLSLTNADGRV